MLARSVFVHFQIATKVPTVSICVVIRKSSVVVIQISIIIYRCLSLPASYASLLVLPYPLYFNETMIIMMIQAFDINII